MTDAACPAMLITTWISGCCQKVWNFVRGRTGKDSHTRVVLVDISVEMEPANNDFSILVVLLLRTDLTGVSWQETAEGHRRTLLRLAKSLPEIPTCD